MTKSSSFDLSAAHSFAHSFAHTLSAIGRVYRCQVISHLYEDYGEDVAGMLDGMFSFVLLDTNTGSFYVARDPIGITSLYIGWGRDGAIWVASEMKCLADECVK